MIIYKYPITLIKFISSYLTNRHLRVVINDSKSSKRQIRAGVPQGSVLGPKLFNIYLNDIPKFSRSILALFADDTAVYVQSYNAIIAAKQIQIHLTLLEKYYKHWKIKINEAKTEVIVFSWKREQNTKIIQPITVYGHKTEPVKTVKYLGVHLDKRLTFENHIKQTIRKVHAVLRKLYPLMVYNSALSVKNKKLIYKMIIRPIMTYAAPAWCGASPTNMKMLQVMQNKCLRLILSANRYTRITDLHDSAEIEYFYDYVTNLAENFYQNQLRHNPLTENILSIKYHNLLLEYKHRLPYQRLPLFYKK